jgi:hypothetical protein
LTRARLHEKTCLTRRRSGGAKWHVETHFPSEFFRGFFFAAAFFDRTSALLAAALRATSERRSGVIFTMRALPLAFPPLRPIKRITSLIVVLSTAPS